LSGEEINVFKLGKPKSFNDLLAQSGFIAQEIEKWFDKLENTIVVAQQQRELISEDNVKDAFHNHSQNIIDLAELIQKKVRGE